MGKNIFAGTVVGFIVLMILGFLIWGVLLDSMMVEMMAKAGDCLIEPHLGMITLATAILALLMALILSGLNIKTLKGGLIAGAWISVLIGLYMGIWSMSTFPFYETRSLAIDLIASFVQGALAGGAIGWVLGKVR